MVDRLHFEAQDFFSVPLAPMDAPDSTERSRILIPVSQSSHETVGVTRQFLEDAAVYHEKYTNNSYFKDLIITALQHSEFDLPSPAILDIGSGSGNSVLPCLDIFEDPRIVATDISPDLLRILDLHVTKIGRDGQVIPVCMDATRDLYREGQFDLVIGAAILHHLIDPEAAISAGLRALKKGGHAIFFEPFEAGHAILRLAYREILNGADDADRSLDPALRVLAALVHDIEVRSVRDKNAEIFTRIDDKWLFTRRYFEEIAARLDCQRLVSYPLHDTRSPFTDQTRTNLRLAAGLGPNSLGGREWEILASYDTAFSEDLKHDLLIEGAIILTK